MMPDKDPMEALKAPRKKRGKMMPQREQDETPASEAANHSAPFLKKAAMMKNGGKC